ncbi:MAG: Ig-like domain-containing protein, partial [Ilumatobacteraceae bacterium]
MTQQPLSTPALLDAATPARIGSRRWTSRVAVVAVIALTTMMAGIGATPTAVLADAVASVPLGLASSFAVLTPAAVGNTATGAVTTLHGDLGVGGALTGFPPGVYTGSLLTGAATDAPLADLTTAYANATSRPAGLPLAPDLLGVTVGPGVHTNGGAVANTGTFTIDAGGDPNAVFIFQIGGALAMAASSHVVLAGQAQAANVFWAVNGAGSVGATATFAGTIMATAAIAVGDGTVFNGRALSKTGAITMTSAQFYSAPPTVTIDGGPSAYTTDTSPTLTGTTSMRSPAEVTVTVNGETLHPVPDSNGVWSATPVALLANATYPVTAAVIDGAGNTGTFSQQLTVDTLPPIVTIDGGVSVVTNNLTPTFTGTTNVATGQMVTFTMVGVAPPPGVFFAAVNNGTWNFTPTGPLVDGQWTVTATVTDPATNSTTASQNVTIKSTGPSAAITSPALSNDSTPMLTGTADATASVTVSIDGAPATLAARSGTGWSYTATASLLDGPHNVAVAATDGTVTSVFQVLTIDTIAPVITIVPGLADTTNDLTPSISGVTDAAPGTIVTVTVSAGPTMLALVQGDGSWNVTPSEPLSPGTVTVTASVIDLARNTGSYDQLLTIDVTAPVVSITGGASRITADATPTISGSVTGATAGAPVTITAAGQALATTVTALLTWSVTAATITNATQVVFVNIVDIAGNIGYANQSLTVIAVAPFVSIDGGPATATNDATPTISGASDAATGSDVVVGVNGQTLHATVQPGGSWSVTASSIPNSTVTVVATVTDLDGNPGSATQSLTINTAGLATISITGGPARTTNDPTPTIAGTTDASNGRILSITIGNQTMSAVVAAGSWSATATHLGDATYPVIVVLSAVGGSPAAASQLLTIDTVIPVVDTVPPGGYAGDDFVSVGPKRV